MIRIIVFPIIQNSIRGNQSPQPPLKPVSGLGRSSSSPSSESSRGWLAGRWATFQRIMGPQSLCSGKITTKPPTATKCERKNARASKGTKQGRYFIDFFFFASSRGQECLDRGTTLSRSGRQETLFTNYSSSMQKKVRRIPNAVVVATLSLTQKRGRGDGTLSGEVWEGEKP